MPEGREGGREGGRVSFLLENQARLGLPKCLAPFLPPSLAPSLTLVSGTAYGPKIDAGGHAINSPALHLEGGREEGREGGCREAE